MRRQHWVRASGEGRARSRRLRRAAGAAALAFTVAAAGAAIAEEESDAPSEPQAESAAEDDAKRIERLEEQIEVLADEISKLSTVAAVPEEIDWDEPGEWGLGPAASKVYRQGRGLSIGGYGDVRFQDYVEDSNGDANVFDALRLVLYTGYKFNDWLVFNSEVEFEHGNTEDAGSVAIEFLTIDFLLKDYFNLRAGLVLIPMGFINEVHEPPFYYAASRPEVERRIIPTTWRENGAGFFGFWDMGDAGALGYRVYTVNGFDARGFSASGLRGGRQNGSEALANDFAFVGRLDWQMDAFLPGATIGGSVYTGKSGQNQSVTRCVQFCTTAPGQPELGELTASFKVPDAFTTIYEVHAEYRAHGLTLRGLFSQAFVDEAGKLSQALGTAANESVARQMYGGYAEIAYDVLPLAFPDTEMSLEPFFRYERVDTQQSVANGFTKNGNEEFDLYVVGMQYKPIPQVVLKVDYRNFEAHKGSIADEVEASIGFVF